MPNKLPFFLIPVFLGACVSITNEMQLSYAEVFDSILIPLDTGFAPNNQRTQLITTDSGEYLAIMNKVDASIRFFSIDQEKESFIIPLFKQGPNRIGVDNGFHIVAKDCLLLATIPPKILIINFQGEIEKSISVKDPNNLVNYLSSTNETPFLFGQNSIFGAQPFFQNIYRVNDSDIQSSKHIYKVNFQENDSIKTKWLEVFRPSDSWKDGKKSMDFTWLEIGDTILVSPHTDHRLWVISKEKEKVISYPTVKSKNVNSFRIIKGYPVGDQGIIETLENDQYDLILYDKFRNVIYRFYFQKIDLEGFSRFSVRELYANRPKMGVMVLNQNLEILGEHLFENFQIEPWNYFVGKKGLYVSTNNPNRDDFDENFLRYDIIRFEGLEYED
ncbi:DUF4221 family protein [Algoriphagus confluentis]|uniref:DUF4221 domain-containing protein n=1 Tax=Algoriphagus confluentis TaxID=1697556 RepID=A0ABQ6PRV5_9BACT|nr:hypothetical protein Aconfl_33820 [Algoriphagus confluentis]